MDLSTRPPIGRRMKGRAPLPPQVPQPAPRKVFRNAVPDGGAPLAGDGKENALRPTVDLHITLPTGYQTTVTMSGRKALMDLLVDLCSQYHLNPAYHTLQLLSPEAQPVAFKPNALLGALDVSCALIRERVVEERVQRKPPARAPEKTIRLVVNYHRAQKAVVRVSPSVPLGSLLPIICQKCELDSAHVLLLRDRLSAHELDLRRSLAELELREVYAFDQTLALQAKTASSPALHHSVESLHTTTRSISGTEKKGLLGLFKFSRRKSKTDELGSEEMDEHVGSVLHRADTCGNGLSMGGPCVEVRPNTLGQSQSVMNLSRLSPKMDHKKRRAPAPPLLPSHTPITCPASQPKPDSPRSASQLKKRKAPAPPNTPSPEPAPVTPTAAIHIPAPPTGSGPSQAPPTRSAPDPPTGHAPVQEGSGLASGDDTSSELSHSIDDSDLAGSIASSSSGDVVANGNDSAASSVYDEPMTELPVQTSAGFAPEPRLEPEQKPEPALNPRPAPRNTGQHYPCETSMTEEEEETAPELKMEDTENNRHSAVAWLHSVEQGAGHRAEQEAEIASMCSNESFVDHGYAASEDMADDCVLLGSPCDPTQPASTGASAQGRDSSSTPGQPRECDSDEGCATWGSRHSGDVQRRLRSCTAQNGFGENADITAQIHLTLANLDADLAEVTRSCEASVCLDDDIPVSIVDVDIPVTAIDEVPGDDHPSERDDAALLHCIYRVHNMNQQHVSNSSKKASVDIQDKTDTACMSEKASVSQTQTDQIPPLDSKEQTEEDITRPGHKTQVHNQKVGCEDMSELSKRPVYAVAKTPENVLESRLGPKPFVRSHSMEVLELERTSPKAPTVSQIKITQSPVSRFGLKTFTVIPPKPTIYQTPKPVHSMDQGAIKIDEFGNMVKRRETKLAASLDKHQNSGQVPKNPDSQLVGKAKAFWSSAEKEVPASDSHRGDSVKPLEAVVPKPVAVVSQPPKKSSEKEPLKKVSGSPSNPASVVENKLPVSDSAEITSLTGQRKDLSFLRPSRRTSSHYVASAIAKYTGNPSAKVDGIPELSESTTSKEHCNQGFRQEIISGHTVSNQKTLQACVNPVPYFAGSRRSLSYPGQVMEKQRTFEQLQTNNAKKETPFLGPDGTESLNTNPLDTKLQERTLTGSEPVKPTPNEWVSTKVAPGKAPLVQNLTKTTRPPIAKKPALHTPGVLSKTTQASMFGPVKTFKPLIQRPVEKESSLHSSLMEAIQSGEGIGRLQKVSRSPRTSPLKKPCYVEADNERSALLSAIRAPCNSARLKTTRSEAAMELERFREGRERKGEDDGADQNDAIPLTPPDPPAFAPPPPPAFTPPPPPPPSAPPAPPSAAPKPVLVLPPGSNPELGREVLLEAIRSGSGAERLRKVPVTAKTVKVNGRLGIIRVSPPCP